MFLVRSVFWLALAFLVLGPKNIDFGRAAGDLSSQAMAGGQKAVVRAVLEPECAELECVAGKAAIAAVLPPARPAAAPTTPAPSQARVPLPRPRPDRQG